MNTWIIDQAHSTIGFKVKHLMVSMVRGLFTEFEGSIQAADDTFAGAVATFTAQAKSINTNNEQRDGHLRSPDFFGSDEFPTITFTSTSFENKGDHFEVVGDLTMRGITKSVTLEATLNGTGPGMDGKKIVSFDVTGKINRQDFGVKWNAAIETGGMVVSDEVIFDIHVEAKES